MSSENKCNHPLILYIKKPRQYELDECVCLKCGRYDSFYSYEIHSGLEDEEKKLKLSEIFRKIYKILEDDNKSEEEIIVFINQFNNYLLFDDLYKSLNILPISIMEDFVMTLFYDYKKSLNKKVYLLRHGLDYEGCVGGYSDNPLTKEGKEQVKEVIPKLRNLNIRQIYSSDVTRAYQTAYLVNATPRQVIETSCLRELDKGSLNGKNKSLLTEEEKKNLNTKDIYEKIGGGESLFDLYSRVYKLVDNGYFDDKTNCLLVTHRGFINMLYYIFNKVNLDYDKEKFGVDHASLHELDLNKKIIRKI